MVPQGGGLALYLYKSCNSSKRVKRFTSSCCCCTVASASTAMLYSNNAPSEVINYLSRNDIENVSLDSLIYTYRYLRTAASMRDIQVKLMFFDSLHAQSTYDHSANVCAAIANDRLINRQTMYAWHKMTHFFDDVGLQCKNAALYKNYAYNDDNFRNLASVDIVNYAPSSNEKRFKNSNLYNDQRLQYLVWRNWGIKQHRLKAAKGVTNDDVDVTLATRCKFSQCHNRIESYMALTCADQHEICYGPLITDRRKAHAGITGVEYVGHEENYNKLNFHYEVVKMEQHDSEVSSIASSSMFSMVSLESSLESITPSFTSISKKSSVPLKSCLKAKSKSIEHASLLQAKHIIMSYYDEIFSVPRKDPVMFSTETTLAKILPYITDSKRDAKISKYQLIEAGYSAEINTLISNWNLFVEKYEERKIQYLYYKEMNMISPAQFKSLLSELEHQLDEKRDSTKEKCNYFKQLHSKNKHKLMKLLPNDDNGSFKLISKLKRPGLLKHGHFVDNLESKRIENLINFQPYRLKASKTCNPLINSNVKYMELKNIICDDDFEIYLNGISQLYDDDFQFNLLA